MAEQLLVQLGLTKDEAEVLKVYHTFAHNILFEKGYDAERDKGSLIRCLARTPELDRAAHTLAKKLNTFPDEFDSIFER